MNVGDLDDVEAILDPGCQIIAMSEGVCKTLGISYNPLVTLRMQSANGTIDNSLGIARNIPCTVAGILIFLQIHVLPSPAYDILLGRPFDVLTESVIRNYRDTTQMITLYNLNTGVVRVLPTYPRSNLKYSAKNFRNGHSHHHHHHHHHDENF